MIRPRAITVCVEFDDILAVTLPHTLRHVESLLVVTSPQDEATQRLCKNCGVGLHITDAFYRDGAAFNKGAALEEGFEAMERRGWILILDADIVLPHGLDLTLAHRGHLWGAPRRIAPDPWKWEGVPWDAFPLEPSGDILGYFQLFHANDAPNRPWYPINYRSAATIDQVFGWNHFSYRGRYLHQSVLHLGSPGENWCGRTTRRADGSAPAGAEQRRNATNALVAGREAKDPKAEVLQQ